MAYPLSYLGAVLVNGPNDLLCLDKCELEVLRLRLLSRSAVLW